MKALEFSHEKSINNHFVIYYKCETIIILLLFYFIDFLIKYGDNEFIEKRNINFGAINLSYINRVNVKIFLIIIIEQVYFYKYLI